MDQLPPSEASTCTIQSDKVFFNWTDTGGSTNCGQAQGLGRNIREEAAKMRVAAQNSRVRFHQSPVHHFSFTTGGPEEWGSFATPGAAVNRSDNSGPVFCTEDGETATFKEVLTQNSNKVWKLVNSSEPVAVQTDSNVIPELVVPSPTNDGQIAVYATASRVRRSTFWNRCLPCVRSSEE